MTRDRGRSVIEGAHIHIFGFTNRENNQFQKKLMRQNPNTWIWAPQLPIIRGPFVQLKDFLANITVRAVARALIGGVYIHISVLCPSASISKEISWYSENPELKRKFSGEEKI